MVTSKDGGDCSDIFCHIPLINDSYDVYFFKIFSCIAIECEEKCHFLSKRKLFSKNSVLHHRFMSRQTPASKLTQPYALPKMRA